MIHGGYAIIRGCIGFRVYGVYTPSSRFSTQGLEFHTTHHARLPPTLVITKEDGNYVWAPVSSSYTTT